MTLVLQTLQWKHVSCHCRHLYSTFFVPDTNGFSEIELSELQQISQKTQIFRSNIYRLIWIDQFSKNSSFLLLLPHPSHLEAQSASKQEPQKMLCKEKFQESSYKIIMEHHCTGSAQYICIMWYSLALTLQNSEFLLMNICKGNPRAG